MRIAIIPARGGSKRIPRKNIKHFLGKPIITYSIKAAIESNCFDRIIVSTDDDEVSKVANEYGADTPFVRGRGISNDVAPIKDVICDAINWFRKNGVDVSKVCCIYATAPFIRSEDIKKGLEMLESNANANFSITVTPFSYPIQRSLKIGEGGYLSLNNPEHANTRSQDLETMYHDAAQFFWAMPSAMMECDILFGNKCCPIIIPPYRVQDLDNEEDWIEAELKYELLQKLGRE